MPCLIQERQKKQKRNTERTDLVFKIQTIGIEVIGDETEEAKMGEQVKELTLEKFEEASEIVKKVTLPTKLVYSESLSQQERAEGFI